MQINKNVWALHSHVTLLLMPTPYFHSRLSTFRPGRRSTSTRRRSKRPGRATTAAGSAVASSSISRESPPPKGSCTTGNASTATVARPGWTPASRGLMRPSRARAGVGLYSASGASWIASARAASHTLSQTRQSSPPPTDQVRMLISDWLFTCDLNLEISRHECGSNCESRNLIMASCIPFP